MMVSASQKMLQRLWWQPGALMEAGWWESVNLAKWAQDYERHNSLRPILDNLIRNRLGHKGSCPSLSAMANELLEDHDRCTTLCIALGLWLAECPDYLLVQVYRQALQTYLSENALLQLEMLIPLKAENQAQVSPESIVNWVACSGASWLITAEDKSVALCALLYHPCTTRQTANPVMSVLAKLMRWL